VDGLTVSLAAIASCPPIKLKSTISLPKKQLNKDEYIQIVREPEWLGKNENVNDKRCVQELQLDSLYKEVW